jgi:hypothetical protein
MDLVDLALEHGPAKIAGDERRTEVAQSRPRDERKNERTGGFGGKRMLRRSRAHRSSPASIGVNRFASMQANHVRMIKKM